ncbi:MAG: hypothetical protein ABFR47_04065 [Verrucomicrobiota bacterium]
MDILPPAAEESKFTMTQSSPWLTFISMLLLIALLALSSTMLIYYASADSEKEAINPILEFALRQTQRKDPPDAIQTASQNQDLNASLDSSGTTNQSQQNSTSNNSQPPFTESLINKFFPKKGNGKIHWPKLEISGLGFPSENKAGYAIINGKLVVEGHAIKDATLVKILEHGVLIEYKGETKTLAVETGQ